MARIFITGSADGLGQLAAQSLIKQGHSVVLHARNDKRGQDAMKKNPGAEAVLIADLADIEATKRLAGDANALGAFDAVIHNAGVYDASGNEVLAINALAPYILTSLMNRPKRLIYVSSGLHLQGSPKLDYLKKGVSRVTYSDTKLHVLLLCMAVARKWPGVYSNAVTPGWVPTKMGGPGATDDLQKGYETQVWLATSDDEQAKVSGHYFFHKKKSRHNPEADDVELQEQFLEVCSQLTGVSFPG